MDKLTESQEALLKEYRNKVFGYATSTVTDKPKAEAAALRLTEAVLVGPEIHWACNPEEIRELFYSLRDSLTDSQLDSLPNSLRYFPSSPMRYFLQDSFHNFLRDPLPYSLTDSQWDSLRNSLHDSLCGSPYEFQLYDYCDSLWDYGYIAYCRFPEIAGIVEYEENASKLLRCYEELLESCFAIYALPGHIILLEKPKLVQIEDGKLVEIEW